jgi:hypothetical protein
MNDDYLWDRTGQPDPEIQELEELLGTLRYQPRPLEIPGDLKVARHRPFVLPVTIAAAIIMVAILSALWFQFRRKPTPHSVTVQQPTTAPAPAPAQVNPQENKEPESVLVRDQSSERQQRRPAPRHLIAYRTKTLTPRPTAKEQAEKEQVLLALRLVSAKLNLAQRKTQGLAPLNNIRNQHKIG